MTKSPKRRISRQGIHAAPETTYLNPTHQNESEQWLPVPNYVGFYEVSSHGRVRSLDRNYVDERGMRQRRKGRMLAPREGRGGYLRVVLSLGGGRREFYIHRIVLLAFVGCPAPQEETRHLDGNPRNNHISNLVWGTHEQNERDKIDHFTNRAQGRAVCNRGHGLRYGNLESSRFRKSRHRACRACNAAKGWARTRGLELDSDAALAYARQRYVEYITDPIKYAEWLKMVGR